jgi:hypothetical protein
MLQRHVCMLFGGNRAVTPIKHPYLPQIVSVSLSTVEGHLRICLAGHFARHRNISDAIVVVVISVASNADVYFPESS